MNVYDFINWFFMYSFLGYLLECIVLSAEYKRPVVDRGFGHGPFCVIYAMATTMELVTANIMVRLFGSFWWDYSHKPFNYKGMVCLESSLAWGLLGLFFFYFLDIRVRAAVISLPGHVGTVLAVGLTMFYLVDFIHCFRLRMGGMEEEDEPAVGRLKIY